MPIENGNSSTLAEIQRLIDQTPLPTREALETADLPGPTGESNRLAILPRGRILCLGPNANAQAAEAKAQGCTTITVEGLTNVELLTDLAGIDGVVYWGDDPQSVRRALSNRDGPLIPVILTKGDPSRFHLERHLCIDTTASGGNAALLAASDQA